MPYPRDGEHQYTDLCELVLKMMRSRRSLGYKGAEDVCLETVLPSLNLFRPLTDLPSLSPSSFLFGNVGEPQKSLSYAIGHTSFLFEIEIAYFYSFQCGKPSLPIDDP